MSRRSQVQKKPVSNSYSPPVQKGVSWQRPFSDPVYNPTVLPQQTPSLQTQPDMAKPASFDLSQMAVYPDTPAGVQAKLTVGAPGDKYEQEADMMAGKVMAMPAPENEEPIQRQTAPEEKKEEEVQTKSLESSSIQREMAPEEKKEEEVQTKSPESSSIQREMAPEEKKEEEVQAKSPESSSIQREMAPEEKKEEEVQTKSLESSSIQREMAPEEKKEEEVQTKSLESSSIQREMAPEEKKEEETPVQAKAAPEGNSQTSGNLESQLNGSKGGGSSLPDDVRSFMEPRFGADFSGVRVHTDGEAVQMNRDLNAQAFTHQQNIFFGAGKAPAKDALTAHELTHVIQQTGSIQAKTDESEASDNESEAMLDKAIGIVQSALDAVTAQPKDSANNNSSASTTDDTEHIQNLQTTLNNLLALKGTGQKDEIIRATQPILAAAKGETAETNSIESYNQQEFDETTTPAIQRNTLVLGAPLLGAGPPGWAIYGALAVGTLAAAGYILMSSRGTPRNNQAQNKQFADAVREIERRIGRKLSQDEIRRLHDAISGQDYGYHDIVEEGVGMFGN